MQSGFSKLQNRPLAARLAWGTVFGVLPLAGCHDNTPPPPRVAVPPIQDVGTREPQHAKPLPAPEPMSHVAPEPAPMNHVPPAPVPRSHAAPAPSEAAPPVDARPPEQGAFVDVYRRVGAPRITLFVNRTLEGQIVSLNPRDPLVSVDSPVSGSTGEDRENAKSYLEPGQYDEVQAKGFDYEAVETVLTDRIAANDQVTVISPALARQQLNDAQVKELQSGRPQVLNQVADQLGADVLIQVQARPTRQTSQGLEVRLVAEAINTRGGQSVARAVIDVPPPLDKAQIDKYSALLARKLMDGMTATWNSPPPPDHRRPETPAAPGGPGGSDANPAPPATVPPTVVPPTTGPTN